MSAFQAVLKFVQVLQGMPAGVIAAERIGLRRPALAAELPMIAVAITKARESSVGIGNLVALEQLAPEEWATTVGSRVKGKLRAELWTGTANDSSTLTSAVLGYVNDQAAALRSAGFIDLSLTRLGPAQPTTAGTDAAFMMPLTFETTFENLVTPLPGGEGVIRTVQVELRGELEESLEIK